MILQEIDKIGGIDFDLKLTFDNGEKYRLRLSGSDYDTFWNMSYYDDGGRALLFPDCVIGGGRCRLSLGGRVMVGQVKLMREMPLAERWINRKLGLDEYDAFGRDYGERFGFEYALIPSASEVLSWAKETEHRGLIDVSAANEIVREIRWLKEPLD